MLRIPNFVLHSSQRLDSEAVSVTLGGKGLNAARVAARFGATVRAIAPVGRSQISSFCELARTEGIDVDFIPVSARTRECLSVLHGGGVATEIIENGAPLSTQTGTELLEHWREHLPRARLALIGGAYPPCPDPAFELHAAVLCQMAKSAGVPVIYDGRGAALLRAMRSAPPWAIKPNLLEAQTILGRSIETANQELRAVRDLRAMGAEIVLLSCGERGSYLGHPGGIEWIEAPRVAPVSSVGCGDALVGAFAARWLEGAGLIEAARWGVAAASASAGQALSAHVSPEQAAPLLAQARVQNREIALLAPT